MTGWAAAVLSWNADAIWADCNCKNYTAGSALIHLPHSWTNPTNLRLPSNDPAFVVKRFATLACAFGQRRRNNFTHILSCLHGQARTQLVRCAMMHSSTMHNFEFMHYPWILHRSSRRLPDERLLVGHIVNETGSESNRIFESVSCVWCTTHSRKDHPCTHTSLA